MSFNTWLMWRCSSSAPEIVEAALIEFLQKYGYKNEIDALLKNK